MNSAGTTYMIAVVGGSGAGKSWFVERLCRLLGEKAAHLHLDHFYRDRSHVPATRRSRINFDVPDAIDWAEAAHVLRDCREGRPARIPFYDFATHCRVSERATVWTPRPVVFVDGLWLLLAPQVRELFHLRIYLDTPPELRCARRRSRDLVERGYSAEAIEQQLRTAVLPMHDRYVEPQRKWADLVLEQPFREEQLEDLADRLWQGLSRAAVIQPWEHATFRAELLDLLANHEYCA